MKTKFYRVDPGGNITAIVKGFFTKKKRLTISKAILKSDAKIEQVGFWLEPRRKRDVARLEMMGGEFCGNGARSLGFVVWKEKKFPRDFVIESSGMNKGIQVSVGPKSSKITIPISSFSRPFAGKPIVCLPGICHFVTSAGIINKPKAKGILKKNNLLRKAAAGIISVIPKGNGVAIRPVVWVRDTKTLYEETACASGTLALAYLKYKNKEGKAFVIIQPSGTEFRVAFKDGLVSLSGPINNYSVRELVVSI